MSSISTETAVATRPLVAGEAEFRTPVAGRIADYAELTKPRIAVMALVAVTVGYLLGCRGQWDLGPLWHALLGIGLAAAASSALNQYYERFTDALMPRTADRPLPAGRLRPWEVLLPALAIAIASTAYLWVLVNPTTAILTLLTVGLYAGVYTPLKRRSALCTTVGAIPGALPPVLGWTAAGGRLDLATLTLFGILFLWQFPHFLAIAWKYRGQYASAGLKMLPPRRTVGIMAAGYALALIPMSLLPGRIGLAGDLYMIIAMVLGLCYAASALRFAWLANDQSARSLLLTSLVYLPALLATLTYDHWNLLQ